MHDAAVGSQVQDHVGCLAALANADADILRAFQPFQLRQACLVRFVHQDDGGNEFRAPRLPGWRERVIGLFGFRLSILQANLLDQLQVFGKVCGVADGKRRHSGKRSAPSRRCDQCHDDVLRSSQPTTPCPRRRHRRSTSYAPSSPRREYDSRISSGIWY